MRHYTKRQICEAIAYWSNVLNESYSLEDLRGTSYDDFAGKKHAPSYERWEAAQLPDPEEDVHGKLASAEVREIPGSRDYLKKYEVHGIYPDGEMFILGPYSRKVCTEYISLHSLSKNARAFQRLKDQKFASIKTIDKKPSDDKLPQVYDIVKLPRGFYLKLLDGSTKIGPFDNKPLARMYAFEMDIELQKGSGNDKVDEVLHIKYPTWLFTYKMRDVECADIVVAEDMQSAMKLFDLQWHVFDNTRPIKQRFSNVQELSRDLSLLRITDIDIEEVNDYNASDMIETAEDIGNPSEKPELMRFCRNPKFKYILGIDMKTGRSPVTIRW